MVKTPPEAPSEPQPEPVVEALELPIVVQYGGMDYGPGLVTPPSASVRRALERAILNAMADAQ